MHFDGYAQEPERLYIAAAYDINPAQVHEAQQRYGFEQALDSLQAMIDGAEWEVGVVCTPTPVRLEVIRTLAGAGKHIFVEKPVADTYAEALQMIEICDKAGVMLAVDQNFRYHFAFEQARQLIAEGLIGNIVSIVLQDLSFRQDKGWRIQSPRHALSVMGVHWFDRFRWIVEAEPQSILCSTRSSDAIVCVGDTDALSHILFENGVVVSYAQSFSSSMRRTECAVIGDKGSLVIHYDGIAHYERHGSSPVQEWANPYGGSMIPTSAFMELNELLLALEAGREPSNSGRDNLKTIALLEAAYRSADERRLITFQNGVPQ
jgi:predicted dehydrogenase